MERRFANANALQSTMLAGLGYGASGAIRTDDETDYHFGVTPQLLATGRFIRGIGWHLM